MRALAISNNCAFIISYKMAAKSKISSLHWLYYYELYTIQYFTSRPKPEKGKEINLVDAHQEVFD